MDPDDVGWEELLARAAEILRSVAARRETITYHRLAEALGSDLGESMAPLLRAISTAEDEAGRGLLTAVVVRSSGLPAGGFFGLAEERGRDVSDRRRAWEDELRRVHEAHANEPGGSDDAN